MKERPTSLNIYQIVPSNRYKKDIKKLQKSGAHFSKLETAIDLLAQNQKLPVQYKDHELTGSLKGIRECHIAPDWLLLYQKNKQALILILLRTGTHRDALGIE